MTRSGQWLRAAATRTALGLVIAGALAGAVQARAAPEHSSANHAPLRGDYRATYVTAAASAATPGYPNPRPLRGNYPGSYASSPTCHAARGEQ